MAYKQHPYQHQEMMAPPYSLAPTATYGLPTAPAMSYSSSTDSNDSAYTTSASPMPSSPRLIHDYLSMSPSDYSTTDSYLQQTSMSNYAPQSYEAASQRTTLTRSSSRSTRRSAQERSNDRYVCLFPMCTSSFSRPADLSRHQMSVHVRAPIDCPKPRCSRKGENGFTRQDHLTEHLRQYHGEKLEKRSSSRSQKAAASQQR
ncbi:hypothetical protein VTO42DRAFT_4386 [Malbranchea cinnamomea]